MLPMYKHSTQKHRRLMLKKHLLPRFGDLPFEVDRILSHDLISDQGGVREARLPSHCEVRERRKDRPTTTVAGFAVRPGTSENSDGRLRCKIYTWA